MFQSKAHRLIVLAALSVLTPCARGWDGYSPEFGGPGVQAQAQAAKETDAPARALADAEDLYRAGRWSAAMEAFQRIVATDADNSHAWLRIGNLQQRRRQFASAASAYRRAASLVERDASGESDLSPGTERAGQWPDAGGRAGIRARALLNLAAVNLELAEAALAAYDREIAARGPARSAARDAATRESIGRDALIVHRRVTASENAPRSGAGVTASTEQSPTIDYLKGAPSKAPSNEHSTP